MAALDSDFVRAQRDLDHVERDLQTLTPGDIAGFNVIMDKINATRPSIENTASKDGPEYPALKERYNAALQHMTDTQELWTNSSVLQPDHPLHKLIAELSEVIGKLEAGTVPAAKAFDLIDGFEGRADEFEGDPNHEVLKNNIALVRTAAIQLNRQVVDFDKYSPDGRPQRPTGDDPKKLVAWVSSIGDLVGPKMEADTDTIEAEIGLGRLLETTRESFDVQVRGRWRDEMHRSLTEVAKACDDQMTFALDIASKMDDVDDDNVNQVSSVAGDGVLQRNVDVFEAGLAVLPVLSALDEALGRCADRDQQKSVLSTSRARLTKLSSLARKQKKAADAKPKRTKKASGGQLLWLDGAQVAEITKGGAVWIRNKRVGDIEATGKIWVSGRVRGEIEMDGDVWQSGSKVGTLGKDRRVWVDGRSVGRIEEDGQVWIGGSAKGTIEGKGDWRHAAIVYYFDFFN